MNGLPDPTEEMFGTALPSGAVTFLFTDIEGSTQRWERDRTAMQLAVRRHDALVRAELAAHRGHVFKTIGDAFCAAFQRPEDAVVAALAVQRALAAEDFSAIEGLRVRMAIATGTADERDGDYFGPIVARVARLLAIGHGGQVLVSGSTTILVQDTLPPGATLHDLGLHRLKDLARPEHIYQLLAPELVSEFPPLQSLNARPNNLPAPLTSFIGRAAEIAEIAALLGPHRFVMLTGPGGVGKTRTSLQVAAHLLDGFADGVWFIELAPLASGDYLPATVALALGSALPANGDALENLIRFLKPKSALLVFDNCEHIVESAAAAIAAILRTCPKIKVLATSRQGLEIAGEETYRLPSLDLPAQDDANALNATDAGTSAAIALFVERARTVDRRFSLTDTNAPTVAEICRRLDGIPLAIELAAARVKILSPLQLRERLSERFRVLAGGSRDALPRQQTLRALIDWSYDLLDARERALFRRLGIFVHGFTLEGAAAVGSGEGLDELDVVDVLSSLVDKSLVLTESAGDALRYRLLESTRMYARDKLDATNEREHIAQRHLRYFRDRFVASRTRYEQTAQGAELFEDLAAELEDVRAALEGARAGADLVLGGEIVAAISVAWQNFGLAREGLERSKAFLAFLSAGEPLLAARLAVAVARLASFLGRDALGLEVSEAAVAFARAANSEEILSEALIVSALSALQAQRIEDAERLLQEAETVPGTSISRRIRLPEARANASYLRGDIAAAVTAFEQLCSEHRVLGNVAAERVMTFNVAELEHARGQTRRAIAIVRDILPGLRAHGNRTTFVLALANLAGYLVAVDDLKVARASAREAISTLASTEPESVYVSHALEHLALAFALEGYLTRAAALAGYVNAAYRRHGHERSFTEMTTHDRLFAHLQKNLASEELSRVLAEGGTLEPEAAVELALEET